MGATKDMETFGTAWRKPHEGNRFTGKRGGTIRVILTEDSTLYAAEANFLRKATTGTSTSKIYSFVTSA